MQPGFESLQLAAFFAGFATSNNAASLWQKHFSEPYSSFQTVGPGHTVAAGERGRFSFELQLQAFRVDLIVRPVTAPGAPPATEQHLRSLIDGSLPVFLAMISDLTIVRVAAVATHSHPVRDLDAAVERLKARVPGLPVQKGFGDVSFQLSCPRPSEVQHGLSLNRLCRWNMATAIKMLMQVGPLGATQTPADTVLSVDEMIDVNTLADVRVDQGLVSNLYEEIFEEIEAIYHAGYQRFVKD